MTATDHSTATVQPFLAPLSPAQWTVVRLLAVGADMETICRRSGLSPRTIRRYCEEGTPTAHALDQLLQDRQTIAATLRDVLADRRATPSTRLSAAALLSFVTEQQENYEDGILPLLSATEVLWCLRMRARKENAEPIGELLGMLQDPRFNPAPSANGKPATPELER